MESPLNIICDTIPQLNREIPSYLLKKNTGSLNHEAWFNASICEYENHILMAYRTDQQPLCFNPRIHIVELDRRNFFPIPETNITLEVKSTKLAWRVDYSGQCNQGHQQRAEDPRLVVVNEELYIFYTDGFKMYYSRMVLAFEQEINQVKRLSSALLLAIHAYKPPNVLQLMTDPRYDGREKNHSPFSYKNHTWIIYSYEPFVCAQLDGNKTYNQIVHDVPLNWNHGFVKGGTPAVPLDKDRYVTFFHSSKRYIIEKSKKDTKYSNNYYYCGALTFDRETLQPLEISRYPIIAPYPEDSQTQVVFPCGVLDRGDHFIISYGYNDKSIKLHALPKCDLEYNLRKLQDPLMTAVYKSQNSELSLKNSLQNN